jgi:hypothetical protein
MDASAILGAEELAVQKIPTATIAQFYVISVIFSGNYFSVRVEIKVFIFQN